MAKVASTILRRPVTVTTACDAKFCTSCGQQLVVEKSKLILIRTQWLQRDTITSKLVISGFPLLNLKTMQTYSSDSIVPDLSKFIDVVVLVQGTSPLSLPAGPCLVPSSMMITINNRTLEKKTASERSARTGTIIGMNTVLVISSLQFIRCKVKLIFMV